MRRLSRCSCALAILVVLVGGAASTAAPGAEAAFPVCTGAQVRSLVTQHLAAFNKGDRPKLDQLWERERFMWYSTMGPGVRLGEEAKRRSTLLRYFADRRAHHERLRLRTFQFNGNSNGFGHFEYRLWRMADELPAAVAVVGKGATTCGDQRRIAVWSMGLE
jgi:hypothetical protein